jgi:transcription-repair coupling factor (superfamily II helicase)
LAIRAAFKAVEFGKQVAVLVPTTILADQHERTFRSRFADYPFVVEGISRFKRRPEQTEILKRVRQGQVDVLIGTHRLLSNDVKFSDLGLVIIDEEQRFGVEHKNKLLQFRLTADVLTLSATPIPRTLHMAMLGLRDISSLSTPPLDRRAVVTEVMPYNEQRIRQAIHRELNREGQVFFLHNRVHNIMSVADDVQKMAPDARIVVGHGQMPERELEQVMREFLARRADILVSTTIIESGIDIPTANTMFINDAHRFGLAELHQLRGRVGRYKHRAYCYLLLPQHRSIPEVARKRLRAIEEFSMLGAGFRISMRDLEIRGAGNLLGSEQSGHIAAVGYDMYCQLLEQSARELRGEPTANASETSVEIGVTGAIPKRYIPSDTRRLDAYRRASSARDQEALDGVERDLTDAYGEPPESVRTLLDLARIRLAAAQLNIRSIQLRERDVIYRTEDLHVLQEALAGAPGTLRHVTPRRDQATAELFHRPPEQFLETATLLTFLRRRLTAAAERRLAVAEREASAGNAPAGAVAIDHDSGA